MSVIAWLLSQPLSGQLAVTRTVGINAATVSPVGDVMVNGKSISSRTKLSIRDRLETGENSIAILTANGSSVVLLSRSGLFYRDDYVDVRCGMFSLAGMGLRLQVKNLQIAASSAPTQIEISRVDGKLELGVIRGSLLVNDTKQRARLGMGQALIFDQPGCETGTGAVAELDRNSTRMLSVRDAISREIGHTPGSRILLRFLNTGNSASAPASSLIP